MSVEQIVDHLKSLGFKEREAIFDKEVGYRSFVDSVALMAAEDPDMPMPKRGKDWLCGVLIDPKEDADVSELVAEAIRVWRDNYTGSATLPKEVS